MLRHKAATAVATADIKVKIILTRDSLNRHVRETQRSSTLRLILRLERVPWAILNAHLQKSRGDGALP